jgi:hypothetical protein
VPFKLPKIIMVIALACSIGLHWAALQSVAWMTMLVSYSQDSGFSAAISKTFDGKHPCCLCKHIEQSKKSEQKSEFEPLLKKFEFSYSPARFVFQAPAHFWQISNPPSFGENRMHPPLLPPPRNFAV